MLYHQLPYLILLPDSGTRLPESGRQAAVPLPGRALFDFRHPLAGIISGDLAAQYLNLDQKPKNAINLQAGTPSAIRLSAQQRAGWMKDYYQTYHAEVKKQQMVPSVRAILEFHWLAPEQPVPENPSPDRSVLCLSNHGDRLGEARWLQGPVSCPPKMLRDFRDILAAGFSDWPVITLLNYPVTHGFSMQHDRVSDKPWIRLDLSAQLLTRKDGQAASQRIEHIRDRLEQALLLLARLEEWLEI